MTHPLQGDGETILVTVEVPKPFRYLLADTPTVFCRAKLPDGRSVGARLHMMAELPGEPRHGIIEIRDEGPPVETKKGDLIELGVVGHMVLRCTVAEH